MRLFHIFPTNAKKLVLTWPGSSVNYFNLEQTLSYSRSLLEMLNNAIKMFLWTIKHTSNRKVFILSDIWKNTSCKHDAHYIFININIFSLQPETMPWEKCTPFIPYIILCPYFENNGDSRASSASCITLSRQRAFVIYFDFTCCKNDNFHMTIKCIMILTFAQNLDCWYTPELRMYVYT